MFSKDFLYINALKYNIQLKIAYKKIINKIPIQIENNTYLAKNDILEKNIAQKINSLSRNIDQVYITTLLIDDETKLIHKTNLLKFKNQDKNYDLLKLNNDYSIAVLKTRLFETKNYFKKTGIDYIYSAFHILNLYIEENICSNELLILTLNTKAFIFILGEKSNIIFSKILTFTAFEDIKKTKFYDNDILGQKLFDEIYSLEFSLMLQSTIENFYKKTKNIFIEKISILYTIKHFNNEQVRQMNEELMINIEYNYIHIDEELFKLTQYTNPKKSFIKARKKHNTKLNKIVLNTFIAIIMFLSIYLFISIAKDNIPKVKEESVSTSVITHIVQLPDHIDKNEIISQRILKSLEIIPYNVLLKELSLKVNSLKLVTNLLNENIFVKTMKESFLEFYKTSHIYIDYKDKPILKAVITNENLRIKKISKFKDYKDIYNKNEFISIITVTEQLKMLFPKNTVINFKSSFKSKIITFNYAVNILIKNPMEFFNIINTLNNELYSINISYPLSFVKTPDGIDVEFILQFHQLR